MTKPLQIRNETVTREIRELAALRGRGMTEAVGEAVREALKREREPEIDWDERMRRVDRIVAEFAALPKIGPMLTDDDLYDEDGMPR